MNSLIADLKISTEVIILAKPLNASRKGWVGSMNVTIGRRGHVYNLPPQRIREAANIPTLIGIQISTSYNTLLSFNYPPESIQKI